MFAWLHRSLHLEKCVWSALTMRLNAETHNQNTRSSLQSNKACCLFISPTSLTGLSSVIGATDIIKFVWKRRSKQLNNYPIPAGTRVDEVSKHAQAYCSHFNNILQPLQGGQHTAYPHRYFKNTLKHLIAHPCCNPNQFHSVNTILQFLLSFL